MLHTGAMKGTASFFAAGAVGAVGAFNVAALALLAMLATCRSDKSKKLARVVTFAVVDIVSLPLKLHDIALLQVDNIDVGEDLFFAFGDGGNKIGKLVVLLELLLGDEVVKVSERWGWERVLGGRGSEAGNLCLGGLEVADEVEVHG